MDNKTITIAEAVERMITAVNIVTGDDGTRSNKSCMVTFIELLKMNKKDYAKQLKVLRLQEALKITGSLSKPSKMPGWAYGLPAKECKTGGKLQAVPGSVCYDCYALKGCYVFKVVQDAQYFRLKAIRHPLWTGAMATIINSKKSKFFRWHDSGDVQDEDHLIKIFAVCRLTPSVKHWMPTREAWIKSFLSLKPDNLVIRFSAPMVNQRRPAHGLQPLQLLPPARHARPLNRVMSVEIVGPAGIRL